MIGHGPSPFCLCLLVRRRGNRVDALFGWRCLTWVVGIDPANRITLLDLRRGPNNHIFDVAWRDIQY